MGKEKTEALKLPNETHPDTPIGSWKDNKVVAMYGEKPQFDFKPKDHLELCEMHDLADFSSATLLTGSKFVILKNEAALLEQALISWSLETLI